MLLTDFIGPVFGTEDFCFFLYSLIKLQRPRVIVELGTGLGASAFWMALAAKQNAAGHVWTVDDLSLFEHQESLLSDIAASQWFTSCEIASGKQYYQEVARRLELANYLTFIHRKLELGQPGHFDGYPFADEPIDLLFSDFQHGPRAILQLLGHLLPRMAAASSIFIDSAPTSWPSYLLLEQLVTKLNRGQVPKALQEHSAVDLAPVVRDSQIKLVHLTEWKQHAQNSTAWLKIEPVDVLPQPRTYTRGY